MKSSEKKHKKTESLSKELLLKMYKQMYSIRHFEATSIQLYREGFIRGYFHPYTGEEAIAVGACLALNEDDYITSTHRGHGHCIAKGADLKLMMAELMGKETGYCRGRGGSMHIANVNQGNLGANGIVGAGLPLAVGAGLGSVQKKTKQVVVAFFSDGAVNNGTFSESLNLAAIWKLPVIFMLENNQYAVSTTVAEVSVLQDLVHRGDGFGVAQKIIDGNNVIEIYTEVVKAVKWARAGKGPSFFEAKTFRHGGHHLNDPPTYIPAKLLESWKAKDPIIQLEKYLSKNEILKPKEIESIKQEVQQEVTEAVEFAKSSPEPSVQEFLLEIESN